MSKPDYITNPKTITGDSFALIRQELNAAGYHFDSPLSDVVERIIHSTADFDFAGTIRLSSGAIESGVQALQSGCAIVCDVNMVRAGISRPRVADLGGAVHCFVAEDETRQRAQSTESTRSAMGIRLAAERKLLDNGIVTIGNAPTALYEVIQIVNEGIRPALIIGVPVGFVSTVESKDTLTQVTTVPWITTIGRKGGSPVAAAIVNALLRLAVNQSPAEVD